jgi:hypothetical membrane protein
MMESPSSSCYLDDNYMSTQYVDLIMFRSEQGMRRLALAGIVGPVVWWLLIIVNGAITPGYSHVSNFMSTLGAVGAPYAVVQQLNFAVLGGSILALMLGIHYWFGDGRRPRAGTILLGVFGVGIILAGVFPEHPTAQESMTNVLHGITGIIGFLAGIIAVGLVSRRIGADDRWPSYRYEAIATVVIVLVTFGVFISTTESAIVGLTQRLFIGVMTLWVVMQSLRLYRLVDAHERGEVGGSRTESDEMKTGH